MFKKTKLLFAIFTSMIILLVGCGGPEIPYKKGEVYNYKDGDAFVNITGDNEWKVKGGRGMRSEALYKVEPMDEFNAGPYSVIKMSLKEVISKKDPWLIRQDYEYYILSPMEEGFGTVYISSSYQDDKDLKKFRKQFESADDKEAFIKQEIEKAKKKYNLNKFRKTS
ncbi:DUF5512 family protein [Bacillus cereus group sp. BfR-BA-01358]|uniref:DUF5512 family protein n=1 Tax=Bacillus cereus group sp. BfR-BA-01358 TaxID=2920320 RepID=UPI00016B7259|nr:DUF5512 family protein [Bacillus cereus group sp. BfR-BA-01358]EDX65299.1 conserved hypothetical protein [Bacillus cereus NVH0597-99]MDA2474598.1 DUF5512 family protein [Bacillus cereus]